MVARGLVHHNAHPRASANALRPLHHCPFLDALLILSGKQGTEYEQTKADTAQAQPNRRLQSQPGHQHRSDPAMATRGSDDRPEFLGSCDEVGTPTARWAQPPPRPLLFFVVVAAAIGQGIRGSRQSARWTRGWAISADCKSVGAVHVGTACRGAGQAGGRLTAQAGGSNKDRAAHHANLAPMQT